MEHIRFGTATPIKYYDAEYDTYVDLTVRGTISVDQAISEDEAQHIRSTVIMELQTIISKMNGTIKFSQLPAHSMELNQQLSTLVVEKFNVTANVSIVDLSITEESKKQYSQKVEAKLKNISNQTAQTTAKYCPNCGTPVTGKFCSNCGIKL